TNIAITTQKRARPFKFSFKFSFTKRAKSPENPTNVKAIKYSINAWVGVKIHASPNVTCRIPHKNPEIIAAKNPHLKATIKIGIIEKEMQIEGIIIIDGNKSSNIASAAKIDTSIIACKPSFFRII